MPCGDIQGAVTGLFHRHDIHTAKSEAGFQRLALAVSLNCNGNTHNLAPYAGWIDHQINITAVVVTTATKCPDKVLGQLSRSDSSLKML